MSPSFGIIETKNQEVKDENSNKNPMVLSVQRDYMAGEVSKALTPHIAQAHQEGIIHIHDLGHYLNHSFNCCLVNLKDMLNNGTVISGVLIEKPHSFSTACNIATQVMSQVNISSATLSRVSRCVQYGNGYKRVLK